MRGGEVKEKEKWFGRCRICDQDKQLATINVNMEVGIRYWITKACNDCQKHIRDAINKALADCRANIKREVR